MGPVFSINLTKEAFDKLCEFRDLIEDVKGEWIPLNHLCSKIILNTSFKGILNEKTS